VNRPPLKPGSWLSAHPTISIIARDRGGGYGAAVAKALPHAVQVADRWQLMENASRAFLDAVRKPKGRSRASSLSGAKCMAAARSICSKPG